MELNVLFPISVPIGEKEMKQVAIQHICENMLGIKGWNRVYHSVPTSINGRVIYKDSSKGMKVVDVGESTGDASLCVEMLKIIQANK